MKNTKRVLALLLVLAMLVQQAYVSDLKTAYGKMDVSVETLKRLTDGEKGEDADRFAQEAQEKQESLLAASKGIQDVAETSELEPYPLQEATVKEIQTAKLTELEEEKGAYCEDTIVLTDTSKVQAEALADRLGAEVRLAKDESYAVLYLPEGTTVEDVFMDEAYRTNLRQMSLDYPTSVSAMDANGKELYLSRPFTEVDDSLFDSQTWLDYVNLQDTWSFSKGEGVKIAVIDTGIDTDHEEFIGKISELSYNATTGQTVRDYGLSVVEDEQGHGTAVAGVIAAAMNNGKGIAGLAPEAELVVIKCECDSNGQFRRSSDLVFALAYAIECDVDVVNMSFVTEQDIFSKYTRLAVDSDIICVAGAGNNGNSLAVYPAADENVIGVGALDLMSWDLAPYSNFGDDSELLAPGTVYTTAIDGTYRCEMGTSMAAPVVAAAVALYLSKNPDQEYSRICELLQASSVDLGTLGEDWYNGYGLLDIHAFVCEEKGTITYEMQTDEVENRTQLFVKGHTLQSMPEPERMNVVFDSWFYDRDATDEVAYYSTIFTDDVTLYANWINEDEGVPYTYKTLADGSVEIVSYTGKMRRLTVPSQIEGKPVSSIGDSAFYGNQRLCEIILPNVTNIGDYAFAKCTALISMDVPEGVRTIGDYAFAGCPRLSAVGLAANGGLTTIGDYAFSQCGIRSFMIPAKVTGIGKGVCFASSGLRILTVAEGNCAYTVRNGALYTSDKRTLVYVPSGISGDYEIADGTERIGADAFAYSRLSQITIPDGVTEIGDSAFAYANLGSVRIPASVVALGDSVFSYNKNLIGVSFEDGSALSVIPGNAFSGCWFLKEIAIPGTVTEIGSSAFAGSGLRRISFGEQGNLRVIGESAFCYTDLQKISIPSSVERIEDGCFENCAQLAEVQFDTQSRCREIGRRAFINTISLKTIAFPESLCEMEELAFYGSGLEQVTIRATVNQLGVGVFAGCKDLQTFAVEAQNSVYKEIDGVLYSSDGSVLWMYPTGRDGAYTVKDGVKKIQDYAFAETAGLTKVVFSDSIEEIGQSAYENCVELQTPVLPPSLVTLGANAFAGCTGMTRALMLPKTVISVGRYAFYYDYNLTDIRFEAESVISRLDYGAFGYCGIDNFTIPASVTAMSQEVFKGCKNLITVTFEADSRLRNLSAWTFLGADELRQLTFEEGSALTLIEARACEGLQKLEKVDLTSCTELRTIDNYAFQRCPALQIMILPQSLEEIGRYAFAGCIALKRLDIPLKVGRIGRYAFMDDAGLNVYFSSAMLPLRVEENWDYGIAGYYIGVTEVISSGDWDYALTKDGSASIVAYHGSEPELHITTVDGHPVVSIGGKAFENNTTLRYIVLPDTLTGIYQRAFMGTNELESIIIPSGVTVIDSEAFKGSAIKSVSFEEGSHLELLGHHAFADTGNLTELALPDTLEKICDYTFYNSAITKLLFGEDSQVSEIGRYAFAKSALTAIELPRRLTKIDYYAFSEAGSLQMVNFPSGQKLELYGNAFYRSGLKNVALPENVSYVGELCFASCENLESIAVADTNEHYTSVDGVLYDKEKKKLICCPAGKRGSYTVPEETLSFAFAAFEGSMLERVILPEDSRLLTIGYRAFYGCRNLTFIALPASVQSVGNYAFYDCESLREVLIPENSQLSGIYTGAFYNCKALETIVLPDGVQEIGDYAFYGCTALGELSISAQSRLAGIYSHAFEYTKVTELSMPAGLQEIGDYAFAGSSLEKLVFNDSLIELGDFAFADCGLEKTTELVIPTSVTYIGTGVLRGATALEEITLPFLGNYLNDTENGTFTGLFGGAAVPESIHTVHVLQGALVTMNAFNSCKAIKTVTLPDEVSWIGGFAFWASGLVNINMPSNLVTIEERAFCATNIKSLQLPESLSYIGVAAFSSCGELESVEWPGSVTSIQDATFFDCRKLENIILPEGLVSIGERAFESTAISEIKIPETVERIGIAVFKGASALTEIYIPKKVNDIGEGAFFVSDRMRSIVVDADNPYYCMKNGVLYDREYTIALASDEQVPEKLAFPETVKRIGYAALAHQEQMKEIVLPDGLVSIGYYAFGDCLSLSSLIVPDSVTNIDAEAFCHTGVQTVKLGKGVTELPYIFQSCGQLIRIDIPEGVEGLYGTFYGCYSLKDVSLPDSLQYIGSLTFCYCDVLETVFIPKNVENIQEGAFAETSSLQSVIVDEENPYYTSADGLLYDADMKELIFVPQSVRGHVTIPEGVERLGERAFYLCEQLEEITLPESLEKIGSWCFAYCRKLKKITGGSNVNRVEYQALRETAYWKDDSNWEGGVLYIGTLLVDYRTDITSLIVKEGTTLVSHQDGAIKDSGKSLELLYLPDSVKYIDSGAFMGCYNLKNVRFSDSIVEIRDSAFRNCSSLKSIDIPESIKEVGSSAFDHCAALEYVKLDAANNTINESLFKNCKGIKTMVIPHYGCEDSWYDSGIGVDNLVLTNTDPIGLHYTSCFANPDMTLYCKVDRDNNDWGTEWNHGMTTYYKDEWHLATFYVDGIIAKMDPVLAYDLVQAPAEAQIRRCLSQGAVFMGWDINGDGIVDQLPATLTEDLEACAVLDIPISGIMMPETLELEVGDSERLKVSFSPQDYNQSDMLIWSSTDESVLLVAEDGTVTAVAEGTAAVKAELVLNSSISAICTVTVIPLQYGIKLAEKACTLAVGDEQEISAKFVLPEGDSEVTVWESLDETVAAVANGVVRAIAPGTAVIVITHGEYRAEYEVTVTAPLVGISIKGGRESLNVGETMELSIEYDPENTTENKTVLWYSTRPSVANVDSEGRVTAEGPGSVEIHAKVGNLDVSCPLVVLAPIQKIWLNTTTGTMRLDHTKQLEVIYEPGNTTDEKAVVWSTDNEEVASVDENGLVTAHKAGHAVITGTVGEHRAGYSVTVVGIRDERTGITVTNSDDSEMKGDLFLDVEKLDEAEMERRYGIGWRRFLELLLAILKQYPGHSCLTPVYDISLMENALEVQPDTMVDVEIPVPKNADTANVIVYRIEEDGTITDMKAVYVDGRFRFQTDHFSVYALGAVNTADVVNLQGTITSAGVELPGAEIHVFDGELEAAVGAVDGGTYSVKGLADGSYTLEASKQNYVTHSYDFTVTDGVAAPIDVELNLIGDVDGDGDVNVIDLNRICDHIRRRNLLNDYELACADVTGGDGEVDVMDLTRLGQHIRRISLLWD